MGYKGKPFRSSSKRLAQCTVQPRGLPQAQTSDIYIIYIYIYIYWYDIIWYNILNELGHPSRRGSRRPRLQYCIIVHCVMLCYNILCYTITEHVIATVYYRYDLLAGIRDMTPQPRGLPKAEDLAGCLIVVNFYYYYYYYYHYYCYHYYYYYIRYRQQTINGQYRCLWNKHSSYSSVCASPPPH